jgi:hypothetical protein
MGVPQTVNWYGPVFPPMISQTINHKPNVMSVRIRWSTWLGVGATKSRCWLQTGHQALVCFVPMTPQA